jgi:hypothetical protein
MVWYTFRSVMRTHNNDESWLLFSILILLELRSLIISITFGLIPSSISCIICPAGIALVQRVSIYSNLLRNKLYYWAVAIETPLADPTRHVKKKQLRDISHKIRRVQLRMHNRKAKCYIPELLVELNSLFKQRDTIRNGNIMRTPHIPRPQKICSVCNYRIDIGYHICKPNPSRPLQS